MVLAAEVRRIDGLDRRARGNRNARMPAALPAHQDMRKAHLLERLQRKLCVLTLCFLKADDVWILGRDKAFDIRRTQAH